MKQHGIVEQLWSGNLGSNPDSATNNHQSLFAWCTQFTVFSHICYISWVILGKSLNLVSHVKIWKRHCTKAFEFPSTSNILRGRTLVLGSL